MFPLLLLLVACGPGRFLDGDADTCVPCPPHSVSVEIDATNCVACPAHTFAASNRTVCVPCPDGTFRNTFEDTCIFPDPPAVGALDCPVWDATLSVCRALREEACESQTPYTNDTTPYTCDVDGTCGYKRVCAPVRAEYYRCKAPDGWFWWPTSVYWLCYAVWVLLLVAAAALLAWSSSSMHWWSHRRRHKLHRR